MRERLLRLAPSVLAALFVAAPLVATLCLYRPVTVAGSSMHPTLHPGDLVLARRGVVPHRGDVVLIETDSGARFIHRVTKTGPSVIWTRGDANPIDDLEPSPRRSVDGRVDAVVPIGRLIERWRRSRGSDTLSPQSESARR